MQQTRPTLRSTPRRPLGPAPAPRPKATTATAEPHPDHHLWRNGHIFWASFTLRHASGRTLRVRKSLRTRDREEARRRRDALLDRAARLPGLRLALRFRQADHAHADQTGETPDIEILPRSPHTAPPRPAANKGDTAEATR